ncbi:MAG: hypothetical protein ABR576_08940 [Thermoanaerobaculia bacterium]
MLIRSPSAKLTELAELQVVSPEGTAQETAVAAPFLRMVKTQVLDPPGADCTRARRFETVPAAGTGYCTALSVVSDPWKRLM